MNTMQAAMLRAGLITKERVANTERERVAREKSKRKDAQASDYKPAETTSSVMVEV